MNKKFAWVIFILFSLSCKSNKIVSSNRKLYYFNFACCFKNDSVIVKNGDVIYFNGLVNTDENTGVDKNSSFTIQSSDKRKTVQIAMIHRKKTISLLIDRISSHKFIDIFYYRDSLYYNESEKFLRGE